MIASPSGPTVHESALPHMNAGTWHDIARLRQDVFVVEQDCAYPDLDGRDLEDGTLHVWFSTPDTPVAAVLRILQEDQGTARRIGRVATAVSHRGAGLAGRLLRHAIGLCQGLPIDLEAQAHLQEWYEGFGFERIGDEFLEDGIPHVPMRRG